MDLIINLIGTITLSCGATPCEAATFPRNVEVIISDGRFNSKVCKEGDAVDPTIKAHEAFIRVRGPALKGSWPGAIACSDVETTGDCKGGCVLYPLRKHSLTISHVTEGSGVSAMPDVDQHDDLRWGTYDPHLVLGNRRRLAQMVVRNGVITFDLTPGFDGMYNARITVPGVSGDIVIEASNASGIARKLIVPAGACIDILNLPRAIALADFDTHQHTENDCDHFFLHYLLATEPPKRDCGFPDDGKCPPSPYEPPLGGTIACSNSIYP